MKKKIKDRDLQKIICKEGFVEILHVEGGRMLPSVGRVELHFGKKLSLGKDALWACKEESMTPSLSGEG